MSMQSIDFNSGNYKEYAINGDENRAEAVKAAVKKIDQACAKGLLHKNNAARKKSSMTLKLNKLA